MASWSPCWRVPLLLAGILYALLSLRAEHLTLAIVDGQPRTPRESIAAADAAVKMWPFNQHMRNLRAWVVAEAKKAEEEQKQWPMP